MAQLPCTTQVANVRKMSNSKLPALTLDDGRLVNDSQQIIGAGRQPCEPGALPPADAAAVLAGRYAAPG